MAVDPTPILIRKTFKDCTVRVIDRDEELVYEHDYPGELFDENLSFVFLKNFTVSTPARIEILKTSTRDLLLTIPTPGEHLDNVPVPERFSIDIKST